MEKLQTSILSLRESPPNNTIFGAAATHIPVAWDNSASVAGIRDTMIPFVCIVVGGALLAVGLCVISKSRVRWDVNRRTLYVARFFVGLGALAVTSSVVTTVILRKSGQDVGGFAMRIMYLLGAGLLAALCAGILYVGLWAKGRRVQK